jgi:hypothetical protein
MTSWFGRKCDQLPSELKALVSAAEKNHDQSAEFRKAMAELQARTAWSLNRATMMLSIATWVLATATVALAFITFYKK